MWAVAAILTILAFAVPMERTVWAADPSISVEVIDLQVPEGGDFKQLCLEFDETTYDTTETVEYETACLKITATGVNSTNFPDLDWVIIIDHETNSNDPQDPPNKYGGPGHHNREGQERYWFTSYEHDAIAETVTAMVKLDWLVPASDYTLDVKIVDKRGNDEDDKAETSTTFSTKSGCVPHPDGAEFRQWYGGGGAGWVVGSSITRTSMIAKASVKPHLAPLNSGRCIYYEMRGNGETIRGSAYVYYRGSGGRNAWVFATGLQPSMYYEFTFTTDPAYGGWRAGFGAFTKGPRLTMEVEDIEQTAATVNVALPDGELEKMGERQVHLVYYEKADEHELNRQEVKPTPKTTVNGETSFSLTNLTAATEYKVDVSLFSGFPTYKTESRTFPTKPGKPTIDSVTPGDGELEVSWDAYPEGAAIDSYTVQWKSGGETFDDAETDGREDSPVYFSPWEIQSLSNGTPYSVRVIAVNASGETASDPVEGTPAGLPDAPKNFEVAAGPEKLTLEWEAPDETGGISLTGYKIQWKVDTVTDWDAQTGVAEESVGTNVLSREITGLTNGTTYDVRVRADNGITGDSYSWAPGDGTPRPEPVVTGVTIADATITQTEATATVAIDNQTGESQTVHLQYRKNTESGWTVETPKTVASTDTSADFSLSGLDGNTVYVVQAWLAATADTKKSVEFTTDPVKPGAPTNLMVTGTADQTINVKWDAPTDTGGSDITGYKVQWKSGNGSFSSSNQDTPTASPHTISGLTNGTEYDIQVIAVNAVGDGPPSGGVSGTPSKIPDPPTSVEVSAHGDRWLEVTWTEPTDKGGLPTTYIVQWKWGTNDFRTTHQIDPATSPQKITNLANGTEYTVRVLAKNGKGVSGTSNTDTGTPMTKPQPPTGVNIKSYGDGSLTVGWTAPANKGGSALTSFTVQWKLDSVSNWDSPTEETVTFVSGQTDYEKTLSSLANGTKYNVRVLAVNGNTNTDDNTSDPSNIASGTPSTNPTAPTEVRITNEGDRTLTVSWAPPANNGGSAINNYKVQWKGDGETSWTTTSPEKAATDRQHIITGLTNGKIYTVQVFARNANGLSTQYGEVTGKPTAKPQPPTNVDVSDYGDKWLEVTWTEPTDKGGLDAETSYIVQWKWGTNDYSETNQATPATSPHKITNLQNGTRYTVRVLAENPRGKSNPSNEDSETPRTIPDAPTELNAVSGDEKLTLTWAAPSGEATGGASITRYIVQWKSGAQEYDTSRQLTPTGASQVIGRLTNGTAYSVRVRADNGETADNYNWKETTGTPMSVPGAPTELKAEEGDRQLEVSWVSPTDTGGADIENFVVQWKRDSVNNWNSPGERTTADENTVTDTITGLTNGVTYDVRVRADNSVEGQDFEWAYTTGKPRTIPSAPRSLNVAPGDSQLSLSWAAPSDNGGKAINRYVVQWKSSGQQYDGTRQATTTSRSQAIRQLTNGTLYSVRVRADNSVEATSYNWASESGTPVEGQSPPQRQDPPRQRSPITPTPGISSVTFTNITQDFADATVSISNAGSSHKTVRVRYREDGVTGWTTVPSRKTTGSSTTFSLSSLSTGTTYEVQAWLSSSTPPSGTQIYTFTTLDAQGSDPSISTLQCENIGQTSATTMVKIANAGTDMKQVFIKHSMDDVDSWTMLPSPTITYANSTSIALTGLQEGTTYHVAVSLTNDFDGMLTCSFTTLAAPSISDLAISDITRTSALATVNIANAGSARKTVYLRHREFGESEWGAAQTKTVTGTSASYSLAGLSPGTTYEVQASLSSDFGTSKSAVFTTLSPAPRLSGISVDGITQTSAVATVHIANPGTASKTVYLRHRASGAVEWSATQSDSATGSSAAFGLTGLTARTTYEVQASLTSGFGVTVSATFTTLAPDPSVSAISVTDITQTSAVATVPIADPGDSQKTVHLQYKEEGTEEWSTPALKATTDGASATIDITGLTADTEYEVQASLDSAFDVTVSTTFTTLRYPSLSGIDVTDITKTTATAEIDIADPDGTSQTVHLRYRTTPQGDWSGTLTTTSTTADASINLTGLVQETEYEVEVSLTSDFAVSVTDTFTTLPPDPVVSDVSVGSILQTTATATINIANADGSKQTVRLRYRTTTQSGDWSSALTTTSSTDGATIDLSALTPGTEYDVQASLDSSFPMTHTKYTTFTTLRYPSIASFEAENVGRNGATVVATIADSRGEAQTVYVRYRQARHVAWRTTRRADSVDDIVSLRLRGLSSGTEYIAEASLDSTFPPGETRSVTFTTKERRDDDDDTGGVVALPARALNMPLPGHSPLTLHFIAIEGGDNPSPQNFSVWNRVYGAMDFILSHHEEWLSLQPSSGMSSGPTDPVTITASVDSSELAAGQYVDVINIKVSSSDSPPGQVIVKLDVLPPDYIRQFVSRADGGVVMLPGGTVKIVVPPLAPPKDVDIELMKLNLMAHGVPPGEQERVVVAIDSNTYPPGGNTPENVAYSPDVELWVMLPAGESDACADGNARVYSVRSEDWNLLEHRCETDEAGIVWVVSKIEQLGAFALVIDDNPVTPTPTSAASALAPANSAVTNAASVTVRTSLPAQPPTPVPTWVPTSMPVPVGRPTVAPEVMPTPTPTAVPQTDEQPAPTLQASSALQAAAEPQDSGGFNGLLLGVLGLPLLVGGGIVVFLFYRERRRNGKQLQ